VAKAYPKVYLEDCLSRRLIFFTGKGGVGKSSLAFSTAVAAARSGRHVRVITWNPFDTVAKPLRLESLGVEWLQLDPLSCFKEYVLLKVKFERVYNMVFDHPVLHAFIRAAPGLSESVLAGKIWNLYDNHPSDLLIVDLPSSGHALSFFQSPIGVHKMFRVGFVHEETRNICEMFLSPETRLDLVALPEEMPIVEAHELKKKLSTIGEFSWGYLHLNQCLPDLPLPSSSTGVSEEVAQVLSRHEKRQAIERDAFEEAKSLELPSLKIPKLPTESLVATIHEMADILGKA
jgi:anion-transporting  ArsA/GET3 family ATPase